MNCPFCCPDLTSVFYEGELVVGLWDRFPVSEGHALLVPRRHVPDWFAASSAERDALSEAIELARQAIVARGFAPQGFNVGMNLGEFVSEITSRRPIYIRQASTVRAR